MADYVLVAGARPNFVKIAPIVRALDARGAARTIVHTGQHYDREMSGVFFEQLGIPAPDVDLQVGSGSHGVQTGGIMSAFDTYLAGRPAPKCVIVVGDVNSTMACALVAVKRGVAVAHVEAGLRSCDRTMPEEINRLVTDAVANLLLVSEPAGLENLRNEGIPAERIRYVGNVMIDSLVAQLPAARELDMAGRFQLRAQGYAVVTLHRPANVDDAASLTRLVGLLDELAGSLPIVFPVHPRTATRLDELGLRQRLDARVRLTAPLGYREFLGLVQSARVVISDSGGVQEETTYLNVPCITMRDSTERPITLTRGTNVLVGNDLEAVRTAVARIVSSEHRASTPIDGWDGNAAERIATALGEAYP